MIWLNVKDKLIQEIGNSFDPKVNFNKRIRVMSDLIAFNYKEDKSVWKQKKGLLPEYYTVYFDDEYVCGFSDAHSVKHAVLEFWKGFKEAYKSGKIRLNQKPIEVVKSKKKIKATTPSEKMAAQIVRRLDES